MVHDESWEEGRVSMARLDDQGDANAEIGTREWAAHIRWELAGAILNEKHSAQRMENLLGSLEGSGGFRLLADRHGTPFPTLEAFCREKRPFGLGYDKSLLDAIITERRTAQARANDAQLPILTFPGDVGRGRIRGVDNTSIEEGGRGATNADYLLARVRRDAPEVFARVQRGEITSARAAAKEAGFLKERWSVPAAHPQAIARYLARKMDRDQVSELIACLYEEIAERRP